MEKTGSLSWLRLRLTPASPFVTPLRGDTLFGQLCWHILESQGAATLAQRLEGYLAGQPYVVISDPFPADHLPRPQLPAHYMGFSDNDASSRKINKGKRWVPHHAMHIPLDQWSGLLRDDQQMLEALHIMPETPLRKIEAQPHNTINRLTMTTGTSEGAAPFSREQYWLHPALQWDIYLLHDARINAEELLQRLNEIGQIGYGKDASTGKGRFHLTRCQMPDWPTVNSCQQVLTLAPCATQAGEWQAEDSFYLPTVRFGRHGSVAAITESPWKAPLLMADTAALLTPASPLQQPWVGNGLGANGRLSQVIPETVHQGYAPVVGVKSGLMQGVQP